MHFYWLLLIVPFFILSVMDAKKTWEIIKKTRHEPSDRADALNLGLSLYALVVCTVLMILMMFGVIG